MLCRSVLHFFYNDDLKRNAVTLNTQNTKMRLFIRCRETNRGGIFYLSAHPENRTPSQIVNHASPSRTVQDTRRARHDSWYNDIYPSLEDFRYDSRYSALIDTREGDRTSYITDGVEFLILQQKKKYP